MMRGPTLVGGMFGRERCLRAQAIAAPSFPDESLLFANGRSAVATLIRSLEPDRVWVPTYSCESLLEAVRLSTGLLPQFIPINSDLQIASRGWLPEVRARDLVILIDYFGFPYAEEWNGAIKERGAWVLEDACGAWNQVHSPTSADFLVASPRKFLGVCDGGVLCWRRGSAPPLPRLLPAPKRWSEQASLAFARRSGFDDGSEDRSWYELFREVEMTQPCGAYAISEESRRRLLETIDYDAVAVRRRRNFQLLLEPLEPWAVYRALPENVVPLGFPIRAKNRDQLQEQLDAERIYPAVHWPLSESIPPAFAESWQLSETILTIPCDQRLDDEQVDRVGRLVRQGLEE